MAGIISLNIGQKHTPLSVSERLFALGFEQNFSASCEGEFSRKGGTLDVWSFSHKTPIRLEFNEDSLISIRLIDLNGRTHEELKKATLLSKNLRKEYSSKKINITFIQSLKTGDYVVHIDHGIGIFKGLKMQAIDGVTREYFLLEYKDKDKFYLPVDMADKIDKYVGAANPKLTRLHGASWHTVIAKTKEDVLKTAKELLDLYAKRKIASMYAFEKELNAQERQLKQSFAYQETEDQLKAIEEIFKDLSRNAPMDRLVCGDVGFGKTEVALRATFKVARHKKQVALIAPTTVLAQQHYDTFMGRLKNLNVKIELLSRFQGKKKQKEILENLAYGEADIVIGTHRLLSKDVKFLDLCLIIIDEEQKFGVKHKERLKKSREGVHVLTLSATPIPRTLNMALKGLRDISLISIPPAGRLAIETVITAHNKNVIKQALEQELKRKGQAYYLYNNVRGIGIKAREISALIHGARVGIAHGQMKESKLMGIMHSFDIGEIDILVCSTIIENGLDLPNVNTLIVDDATKFGLSQLYQIRGRIGRGDRQSFAYFLYHRICDAACADSGPSMLNGRLSQKSAPNRRRAAISANNQSGAGEWRRTAHARKPLIQKDFPQNALKPKELKRLAALKEAQELGSGFNLAMRDMEIRGIGNILGKKQHGSAGAIGLSFYLRMLNQTVEELQSGASIKPKRDISIDLPIEFGITEEFEPYEHQRLRMYNYLASLNNIKELAEQKQALMNRALNKNYSQTSVEKLENLFYVLELKSLAQGTGISSIDTFKKQGGGKKLVISFDDEKHYEKLPAVLEQNPNWHIGEMKVKIDMGEFGRNWKEELKKTVSLFRT